jgi:hypothetical protein
MSLQGPKAPKGSTVVGSSEPLLDLFIQYHQIPILIPKGSAEVCTEFQLFFSKFSKSSKKKISFKINIYLPILL